MDISNITRMISALRAQTAPDSITPDGLGSILQAIADVISALSNINVSTETDLIARVEQVEGNMQTALNNAQAASTLAQNARIVTFSLGSDNVTVMLKQHGYSAMTFTLEPATTQLAGVMSAEDKDHLDKAYGRTLANLYTSSYDNRVVLNYKRQNNQVVTVNLYGASSSAAGLMTAADKVKLEAMAAQIEALQQRQQDIMALEGSFAPLLPNQGPVIPLFQALVLLDSMGQELDTVDGATYDFTAGQNKCWYIPNTQKIRYWWDGAASGVNYEPSRFPGVFMNKVTGRCYRWNSELQEMQEWLTNLM